MDIITAIKDRRLFRGFLADKNGSIQSWRNWMAALRILYGLPVPKGFAELVEKCTGRRLESFEADNKGFDIALFLTGRRSGKSRIASTIAAYESVLTNKTELLSPGELGVTALISVSKKQGRVCRRYTRSIFELSSLLESEIIRETAESFELDKISIEILISDFRSVRGHSVVAAILDECCFLGVEAEAKVRSDTELVRAILPSLSTTQGRLVAISSPYMRRGWAFRLWKRHWGKEDSNVLVWKCDSRTMNPTLSQKIVDDAMLEDKASALAEYGGEWRSDISVWLPPEVVEQVIVKGRKELIARRGIRYFAFCDLSGGRSESAALCIGHKDSESKKVVVDYIQEYKSPHDPRMVIQEMCNKMKRFSIHKITADSYAAEFAVSEFRSNNVSFEKCKLNKSQLYLELLPMICSKDVILLDHPELTKELCGLIRFTRSGGKDKIDHSQGSRDDIANACAGLVWIAAEKMNKRCGVFLHNDDLDRYNEFTNLRVLSSMY